MPRRRKIRTPPAQLRYITRLRASGLKALHGFVRQAVTDELAATARRHDVPQSVVLDAALAEGLRHTLPSTLQQVQQRRRRSGGEGATVPSLSMKKNGDAGA